MSDLRVVWRTQDCDVARSVLDGERRSIIEHDQMVPGVSEPWLARLACRRPRRVAQWPLGTKPREFFLVHDSRELGLLASRGHAPEPNLKLVPGGPDEGHEVIRGLGKSHREYVKMTRANPVGPRENGGPFFPR